MGYEINISKNGSHHFATNDRSFGFDLNKVKKIYSELKSIYTEDKGFSITVTLNTTIGNKINMEEELMTNELTSKR